MPYTEAELYVLRDFNTLGDDEAYQIAFGLLEAEFVMRARMPIPPQNVISLNETPPIDTLLFDIRCNGTHYAAQIIGPHMVRVSEVDLTTRKERIIWRSKKHPSHEYPFLPPSDWL